MISALQRLQSPSLVAPSAPAAPASASRTAVITELRPQDQLQRTAAVGQIPATLSLFAAGGAELSNALKQIQTSPTEASVRSAQAGFRVALRPLDLASLQALQAELQQKIASSGDFRTQRLLDALRVDLLLEIASKGGPDGTQAPQMPPLPGKTPESIVQGSLKQLHSHASEENYRTARAGFRVALRSLSAEQLLQTRQLAQLAAQTTGDYRSQLLIDEMLSSIAMEQIGRGIQPEPAAIVAPPALGQQPATIAANAVALLQSSATQSQFRTAVAAVRVAARSLDQGQVNALKAALVQAMQQTGDYRTQRFLDQVSRELF
ncbi:MAG: hypothetical protein ACO1RX_22740 [Candidatus Sericytochromatia bacterium]